MEGYDVDQDGHLTFKELKETLEEQVSAFVQTLAFQLQRIVKVQDEQCQSEQIR